MPPVMTVWIWAGAGGCAPGRAAQRSGCGRRQVIVAAGRGRVVGSCWLVAAGFCRGFNGGGRRISRVPAARPFGGSRGSSPLPSGGAGTTETAAARRGTSRPSSPGAAPGVGQPARAVDSPSPPLLVRVADPGVRSSGVGWFSCMVSPWRMPARCVSELMSQRAGIAAGFTVAGGTGHDYMRWPARQPYILRRVGLCVPRWS